MADGYEVSVEMLQRHATNIARIIGQLDAVKDAARAQSIPEDAFGLICATMRISDWLVAPLHDRGVTTVNNAIGKAEEIRAVLGTVGRAYDRTDLAHADDFAEDKWLA